MKHPGTRKEIYAAISLTVLALLFAALSWGCGVFPSVPASETPSPGSLSSSTEGPAATAEVPETAGTEPAATATLEPLLTPETTASPEAAVTPVWPENEYNIGTGSERAAAVIGALAVPEAEILTAPQIEDANRRMAAESDAITDVLNLPDTFAGEALAGMLAAAKLPSKPLYDAGGREYTDEELEAILANRNLEGIPASQPVRPGIVVNRTDLKRFPTDGELHSGPGTHVDLIQDTELYLGMPVWIMRESSDGAFLFVQSYWYSGWVKAEDVAAVESREAWLAFADPAEFAVVTEARLDIDGVQADMGVKLPLAGISADGTAYEVDVPARGENGALEAVRKTLPANCVHKGYLAYTYANFVAQAFKYLGTDYAWGGIKGGVDCSSYVASVMRSFGFLLPRDTKDQQNTVGTGIDLTGRTEAEIAESIRSQGQSVPVAIYNKGHVKFYLPGPDGSDRVIQAPGSGKQVSESALDNIGAIVSLRVLNG